MFSLAVTVKTNIYRVHDMPGAGLKPLGCHAKELTLTVSLSLGGRWGCSERPYLQDELLQL